MPRWAFLASCLVLAWGSAAGSQVAEHESSTPVRVTSDAQTGTPTPDQVPPPRPIVVQVQEAPDAGAKQARDRGNVQQALDYSGSATAAAWWQVWVNAAGAILIFLTLVANAIMAKASMDATKLAREAEKDAEENLRVSREMMEWAAKSAHAMDSGAAATRRLAGSARESAEAARRSVEIAADTTLRQLRPYVYVAYEHVLAQALMAGLVSDTGSISLKIQNFGQTPAKRVTMRAVAFIGGYWSDDFVSDLDGAALIEFGDMPPGFVRTNNGYSISGLAIAHKPIEVETQSIVLDGLIEYEDASGGKYSTAFRRACTGENLWTGVFFVPPFGNDAT